MSQVVGCCWGWLMGVHYDMAAKVFGRIGTINSVLGQLEWDLFSRVPKTLNSSSAANLLAVQDVLHGMLSSNYLYGFIENALENSSSLSVERITALTVAQDVCKLARAVPAGLLVAITKDRMSCYDAWKTAVESNDYGIVVHPFDSLLQHMREYLQIKAGVLKVTNIYDAALRSFCSDLSSSSIDGLFLQTGKFISEHNARLIESAKHERGRINFPVVKQEDLAMEVLREAFQGRLNLGVVMDGRHERAFSDNDTILLSLPLHDSSIVVCMRNTLHNIGRAMFKIGRCENVFVSGGGLISEVLSAMLAFHVGSSEAFAVFLSKSADRIFDTRVKRWNEKYLFENMNKISCSLNRMECDELFSVAHLMMRYSIERELLSGNISAESLPDIWQEGSRRYFKASPKKAYEGCLQDVHWYQGVFGYFPVQAVGIMMSRQLFTGFADSLYKLESDNLAAFLNDIAEKVVTDGMTTQEIITLNTGQHFSLGIYLEHLQSKYGLV